MKILITGGGGFIASHFIESLQNLGHEIVVFDLVPPPPGSNSAEFIRGDLRNLEAVTRALAGCDKVLHLAAAHFDFGIDAPTYHSVNVDGARVLCQAMQQNNITDCCFYSTVAVYGTAPGLLDETTSAQPDSPYGATKLQAEAVFQEWVADQPERRCLVIRPTVTFGPRNYTNMYSLIRQINKGLFFQIGKGDNIKSLSYVENIVAATIFLWFDPEAKRENFDIFNYVEKPDLCSSEITNMVYRALGKTPPRFRLPYYLTRVLALPLDLVIKLTGVNLPISGARIKKLSKVVTKFEADKVRDAGFKAEISIEEGIQRMVDWFLHGENISIEQGLSARVPPSSIVETREE